MVRGVITSATVAATDCCEDCNWLLQCHLLFPETSWILMSMRSLAGISSNLH